MTNDYDPFKKKSALDPDVEDANTDPLVRPGIDSDLESSTKPTFEENTSFGTNYGTTFGASEINSDPDFDAPSRDPIVESTDGPVVGPTVEDSNLGSASAGTDFGATTIETTPNYETYETNSVSPTAGATTTGTSPAVEPIVQKINEGLEQLIDDPALQARVKDFIGDVAQLLTAKSSELTTAVRGNPKEVASYSLLVAGTIMIGVGAYLMYDASRRNKDRTKRYKKHSYRADYVG